MHFTVELRDAAGEYFVQDPDENERKERDPRIGETLFGKRFRFVEQIRAVTFPVGDGAATAPMQIQQAGGEDEDRADAAKPRRRVGGGLEEGDGNDVLNLRR